ncbi:MAG: hypothetical protein AB8B58_16415 [Roseobacter sp.]
MHRFTLLALLPLVSMAQSANALEVAYTDSQARCLVDNADAYLEANLPILLFAPSHCPDISGVAKNLVLNSDAPAETAKRLMMNREQFRCMVSLLDDALNVPDEDVEAEEAADDEIDASEDAPADDTVYRLTVACE